MITTSIRSYSDAAAMAAADAAAADPSNESRVLALAARLRSPGSIPIPCSGLMAAYVSAFCAARGLDMSSLWTGRPSEYLSIRTPDGRSWIRRYATDAAADVRAAMLQAEDVSAWSVTVHR